MKKTSTLIFLLLTSCFVLWSADDRSILLEQAPEAACPCTCDKNKDLAVLQDLYNNNGGANWKLDPNIQYQSLINNSININVPNAGNAWNINAPDAQDQMGDWHGIRTNSAGCVTEIILWSGIYNGGDGVGVTGTLPTSLNELCALQKLMLPHNDITGPLPADLDDLCNLIVLLLQNNELEGPLPPEMGNMNNLVHLGLHDNQFTGVLPSAYMDIPELLILHLRRNKLEGVIPGNINNLDKVVLFDISDNCFSGTVPKTIEEMGRNSVVSGPGGGLLRLSLQNNKFDSLPDISSLKFLGNPSRSFDVSGNHFTFDDIIPNRNILTKYNNQTIDLDLYYCLQTGESITIRPGFDESIDLLLYGFGTRSRYLWARGTTFSTASNINQITFSDAGPNSAGSFTIEVTNPLAPNLTLLVTNLVIDILGPTLTGVSTVCMGTSTTLGLDETYANYNWSTGESTDTIVINEAGTYSVTVSNEMGCTASRLIDVVESESPPIFIAKTNDLDCDNDIAQVYSTTSGANIAYEWTDETGNVLGTNTLINIAIPGFYTLTISNTDGCTNQASIEVLRGDDIATPEIEGNLSFCEGEVSQLSVMGNYASYAWSTGSSNSTIEVDSTGSYTVTVTSSSGCVAVNSTNVSVMPLPTFTVVGDKSFCPDASTTLSIDTLFTSYSWSTGDTTQEATFTTVGEYDVTVTNANNCSSMMAFTIDVVEPPVAKINGDSTICIGNSISLFGSPLNSTFDWSTGESESFLLASAAGTYGLTVTDENGCTASTTKTLTEISQPVLNLIGDTIICKNGTTTLAVIEDYTKYLWSTGVITQSITIDTAGSYTVTVTNDNGCENEVTHIVTESAGPILPVSENVFFCEGDTITIQALEGFPIYNWADGQNTSAIEISEAMNYFLTVTDDRGCTSEMFFTAEENTRPEPEIIGDAFVCLGAESSLSTSEAFAKYLWSDGDTLPAIFITEPGTYAVTVSNATNCTETASFFVAESPDIDLTIIGNTAICSGESTRLRADDNYLSYIWSTGDTTEAIPVNSAGNYSLTVTNDAGCTGEATIAVIENDILFPQIIGNDFICQDGLTIISADDDYTSYIWSTGSTSKDLIITTSGTYQLIVTNAAGCTGETSIEIVEVPLLQPSIIGATTFCEGESTKLELDTTYASYRWSTDEISSSIEVTEGIYEVTISNAAGCTGSAQIQVEEQASFTPGITSSVPAICAEGVAVITAEIGFVSYEWSATISSENLFPSSTIFVINPDTYTLTVTDANGCQGIDSIVIEELPAVKLAPGVTEPFCSGDSISTELSLLGFSTYEWSTGDTIPTIFVEKGGTYNVTVTNEFGCIDSTFFEVTEYPSPLVNVNNAGDSILNLCKNEETILFGVIDNTFNYRWENESGEQIGLTPVLEVDKPGSYRLVVEDENGCVTTESTQIYAISNPIVLNIDTTSRILDCENRVSILDASLSKNVDYFFWQRIDNTAINFLAEGKDVSTYEVTTAGNYRVIVENEETGCRETAMITVTENIENLSPVIVEEEGSITIEDALQVCEGQMTKIKVRETYQKYEWQTGDTTQNLDSVSTAGIYTVTVTDERACTGETSVKVLTKRPEDIRVEIASDIAQVCEGEEVKINFNILSGGTGPYDISYTDGVEVGRLSGVRENVGSVTVIPTNDSRYGITDIVDLGDNCVTKAGIDTTFLSFYVQERPLAYGITKSVCAIEGTNEGTFDLTKYITEINDDSNLPVNWYFEEDINSSNVIYEISDFLTPQTTIYATVLGSCESYPVPVILEVNNCGNNLEMTHEAGTVLDLGHLDGDDREVYITNRWGDLVFASTDYEGFENKFKGTDLPQGAYYIYIKNEEKGLPVPYKGVIYLLKAQ